METVIDKQTEIEDAALRALARLGEPDPFQKFQIDQVSEFVRNKIREDGFYRRMMPPILISNDELDRQASNNPQKIGY